MNATKKALTTLAVAAAMAGGVSIAQTSGTSTDTSSQNPGTYSSQSSAPATSNDTSSSTMSNSTTTESSTMSNTSPAPQADRG